MQHLEFILADITESNTKRINNIFSDNYAGAYINVDGDLVVLVTNLNDDIQNKFIKYTNNDELIIDIVVYSLNYLTNLKEIIEGLYINLYTKYVVNETKSKESKLLESMTEIYIDETTNSIIVGINNINEEKIKIFNEIFIDTPAISFVESEIYKDLATTLYSGQQIIIKNSGSYYGYSIGFRAWKSTSAGTIYGFVTAGHGNAKSDIVYDTSYNEIGYVYITEMNETVDAAFIYITKSYDVSNTVKYSNSTGSTSGTHTLTSTGYMSSISEGSTIYLCGYSSYLQSGKLESNNASETISGMVCKDMLKIKVAMKTGDSGGTNYMYHDSKYHLASITSSGNNTYTLSIKIPNILTKLDVMFY